MAAPEYEKDGRTHTATCPCDFCKATYEAFDRAAQKFMKLAQEQEEQEKSDKKKKK